MIDWSRLFVEMPLSDYKMQYSLLSSNDVLGSYIPGLIFAVMTIRCPFNWNSRSQI